MAGPVGKMEYYGHGKFRVNGLGEITRTKLGFIAGGTGLTPLYHMMQASLRHKDGCQISWISANSTPDDMLLVAELDALKAQHPDNLKLTYLASKADESWTGLKGRINKDLIAQLMPAPSPDTYILYCGPKGFNEVIKSALIELGYAEDMFICC